MGFFKRLFGGEKKKAAAPRVPTWDEVAELMYDKGLSYVDEVVEVIYTVDKSRRYVVLKSDLGHYGYLTERLVAYDADELNYFGGGEPGYWLPEHDEIKHFFDSYERAISEMRQEPVYKLYFENEIGSRRMRA